MRKKNRVIVDYVNSNDSVGFTKGYSSASRARTSRLRMSGVIVKSILDMDAGKFHTTQGDINAFMAGE